MIRYFGQKEGRGGKRKGKRVARQCNSNLPLEGGEEKERRVRSLRWRGRRVFKKNKE